MAKQNLKLIIIILWVVAQLSIADNFITECDQNNNIMFVKGNIINLQDINETHYKNCPESRKCIVFATEEFVSSCIQPVYDIDFYIFTPKWNTHRNINNNEKHGTFTFNVVAQTIITSPFVALRFES